MTPSCRFHFATLDSAKWAQFVEQFIALGDIPTVFVVNIDVRSPIVCVCAMFGPHFLVFVLCVIALCEV